MFFMHIKQGQLPILIVNLIALIGFSVLFIYQQNYEFIYYVGVIIFFLVVVLMTNRRVNFPNTLLWGLTLWSLMHMTGGGIKINGEVVYRLILIPLIGEPYNILKYDQLVHMIGFGLATYLMFILLEPLLKPDKKRSASVWIIVIMAGLGVGALNEMVEFIATVVSPETGVGGYMNTLLDLVADFIGGIVAMLFIWRKKLKPVS
ncbi:hypothetical protein CL622_07955 [archaeon]|nr:hypothetical protein [archaeon]